MLEYRNFYLVKEYKIKNNNSLEVYEYKEFILNCIVILYYCFVGLGPKFLMLVMFWYFFIIILCSILKPCDTISINETKLPYIADVSSWSGATL